LSASGGQPGDLRGHDGADRVPQGSTGTATSFCDARSLSTRPAPRRAEVPWGGAASDPAVERLFSLMAANSATHAIVLSRSRRSDSACGPRHFRRSGHRNRARTAATPVGLDARGGVTNKAAELIWRVRN